MKNKKTVKFISGLLVASISLTSLSSCAKNVECDISEAHAHFYTSDSDDLDKYIVSEKESKNGLKRTNTYIEIDDNIEKLIKFENSHSLYRRSLNEEKLKKIENSLKDYTEYEYKYRYCTYIKAGKAIIPVWHTSYRYTTDENHENLTGKTRLVHHMYRGYKIEKNKKGKSVIVESDLYEKIDDIPLEYIYVKEDVFEKIYKETKKEVITYKDSEEQDYKKNLDKESQESYKKTK